ncbi:MAG: HNH endonuclease [Clostridium sp.]|uniref:HNH endonuclease n=1 Tax=Clostridium sp. TaxID=1506 RepID=UPI002900491C|nr:HNH endonuclease [Clostridium sp.]MDU1601564.1 HNH endonuclease [Clostridium sp.]
MIGIRVGDESIVEEHYEGIKSFFNNKTKYTYKKIDNWIRKITCDKYSFEEVIKAKPNELEKIIFLVDKYDINKKTMKTIEITKKIDSGKEKKTIKQKVIFELPQNDYMIYVYKKFASEGKDDIDSSKHTYGAINLVNNLGLNVCPYCNRNFIVNTKAKNKDNKEKFIRTCQLDHFYPESKYPYLALSFYNLIPSCPTCNKIKLDNLDIRVNPYSIKNSDDNIIFDYDFDKSSNRKIISHRFMSEAFEKNWKGFGLHELYRLHSDYLNELLMRMQIYNTIYSEDLDHKINAIMSESKEFSADDAERIILGNYYKEEDLSKQPLAKLTKDIYYKYK